MDDFKCLGKTPGYVRYSGYDTPEQEAEYLPFLGPIWKFGDPLPPWKPPMFCGICGNTAIVLRDKYSGTALCQKCVDYYGTGPNYEPT